MSTRRGVGLGLLPSTHKETKMVEASYYVKQAREKRTSLSRDSRFHLIEALHLACADVNRSMKRRAMERRAMIAALMSEDTETIERFLRSYHSHLGREDARRGAQESGGTDPSADQTEGQSEGAAEDAQSETHTCSVCGDTYTKDQVQFHMHKSLSDEPESHINCPNCETPMSIVKTAINEGKPNYRICENCGYSEDE